MNLPRRKFFRFAVSVAALPAMSRIARAQAYPTHPVRSSCPIRREAQPMPPRA
jgi:hypothetical protein